MHRMVAFALLLLCIELIQSEIVFQSLCSTEAQVPGMSSIDGADEFEIDLYDDRYLPDDTILRKRDFFTLFWSTSRGREWWKPCFCQHLVSIKQKRANDGIREFVLRAFDYDNNVIGRFDDQHTGNLALRHQTCPNGTSVSRMDRSRASDIHTLACVCRASSRWSTWIAWKAEATKKFRSHGVQRVFLRTSIKSSSGSLLLTHRPPNAHLFVSVRTSFPITNFIEWNQRHWHV